MTLVAVVIVVHLVLIAFGSPLMPPMGQGKCVSQGKNSEFIQQFRHMLESHYFYL
jgi:hypothetical protein